jgi:hypothetical protein
MNVLALVIPPGQDLPKLVNVGVTITVATTGVFTLLVAVKLGIDPKFAEPKPILELEFVHE